MPANGFKRSLFFALIAALAVAACSSGGSSTQTVKIIAEWSGAEQDSFLAVLKPFKDANPSINVTYESTRDENAVLRTRVAAGNPPDLAAAPNPTLLAQFASQGKVVSLDDKIDMTSLRANYPNFWLDLGTINGKLYQTYSWVDLKGLIWYSPKNFTSKGYQPASNWEGLVALTNQIKSGGTAPWCVALKSGGADDGWPGSDWLKEIVLSQSGPDVYDQWVAGKIPWSSKPISDAFKAWGTILGPGDSNVFGGAERIRSESFKTGGNAMFENPPKCYMYNQATFIPALFKETNPNLQAGTDYNFFPLPDFSTQYAGAHVVAGDAWSMFKDSPGARKLMNYLTSADAQVIWVKRGGKLSPNNKTPLDSYPDVLSKEEAQTLVNAKIGKYDATDLMPSDMRSAAWKAVLDYANDQSKLPSILATLDQVQKTAYTS